MTNNRRSRKAQKRHYRRTRRHGGSDALHGAPLNYSLADSWSSRMSQGQGKDFFDYHKRQHGGAELIQPAPLSAIENSMLPQNLRASAHINGLDAAIKYSSQFKDQAGGRRTRKRIHRGSRRHRHSRRCHHGGKRKSQRKQRKQRRSRGGALEYAPFPSNGMLLNRQMYAQAGLSPSWKCDPAFIDAKIRDSQ